MGHEARRSVLIAGPTASGKSAAALALAQELGGIVINADSKQIYADLRVITARPTPAEEALVPHRLYGHVDAAATYSVGHWLKDAGRALAEAKAEGKAAILVGGTGLYFKALTEGLADVPEIPDGIRSAIRARIDAEGPEALHAELARRDPVMAARVRPADRPRIARALEVVEATGRSLADWHRDAAPAPVDPDAAVKLFLAPDRAALYRRIDRRFDGMVEAGVLEEVSRLAARGLDPLMPAMKAHGVPWLRRHLMGEMSLADAVEQAKLDTRHYAKRQFTWFRRQLASWPFVAPEEAVASVLRAAGR